ELRMNAATRSSHSMRKKVLAFALGAALAAVPIESAFAEASIELKQALAANVDARAKLVQEMVDSVFSFAEPGFQEFETSKYLTGILEANGFTIERGIAGIPT